MAVPVRSAGCSRRVYVCPVRSPCPTARKASSLKWSIRNLCTAFGISAALHFQSSPENFGAVDYHCRAFFNGKLVGDHKGGYVSFSFDITEAIREGENEIAVFAQDDTKDRLIPSGKQSARYGSYGCYYTRTTGIWQTVWLEFMPESCIESIKYYHNVDDCSVAVEAKLQGRGGLLLCRIL